MFIKEIKKRNKHYDKEFISHRLVESYRSEKGPRHRTILHLGELKLPREAWKALADTIEAKLSGQQSLYPIEESIERLADHYAQLIIRNRLAQAADESGTSVSEEEQQPRYETINLNSIENSKCRTVGAEYVGISIFKELGLDAYLKKLNLTDEQVHLAQLSVVGRLVHPASELNTAAWARHTSAMDELISTDFSHLSHNALYRISDVLFKHKEPLENYLARREKDLFHLEEKIILYDLTNTYFEGSARSNSKARHGRSKEKRSDCPLLTLGMVIDEQGFPKTSRILPGNVSEPGTLQQFLTALRGEPSEKQPKPGQGITVVMDAGIATDANRALLKELGYDYIVVARNQPVAFSELNMDQLITVKQDRQNRVEVELIDRDGERILFCKSKLKAAKEQSMKQRFQQHFEQDIKLVASALHKKYGTKNYDKVMQKIGRLKQKYSRIAAYYQIDVKKQGRNAVDLSWKQIHQQRAEERFSGSYFLRTSRTDLDEKQIWSIYTMLTNLEDAFRSLKSELELRPIRHHKEHRSDAHLFIGVLAYHLLNTIQTKLRKNDIHIQWWRVRQFLSTHVRITTSMTTRQGKRIHIRKSTQPELFHKHIYQALGLTPFPLKTLQYEN
jgi:transposase